MRKEQLTEGEKQLLDDFMETYLQDRRNEKKFFNVRAALIEVNRRLLIKKSIPCQMAYLKEKYNIK